MSARAFLWFFGPPPPPPPPPPLLWVGGGGCALPLAAPLRGTRFYGWGVESLEWGIYIYIYVDTHILCFYSKS